jgi:hypothetical protein
MLGVDTAGLRLEQRSCSNREEEKSIETREDLSMLLPRGSDKRERCELK